jgi:flagellar motility protein MotE (MotC chaperone)
MQIRVLPVAIGALTVLFGAKVVDVWTSVDALLVSTAVAQQQPAASAPSTPDPTATPAAQAASAPSPVTPADPVQVAAASSPKAIKKTDFPDDPTLYSPADIDVLQQLADRRAQLEQWASDLAMREQLLKVTETRLEGRLGELNDAQGALKGLLRQYDQEQETKLKSLVKVYEAMKPRDAARIFEQLEMDVLLDVVERMKEAKVAPVLAAMNPDKAKDVTFELAQRRKMGQQLAMPAKNQGRQELGPAKN